MTWLSLFLRLSSKGRLPITGDGAPSWSDVDEVVSPAPGPMTRYVPSRFWLSTTSLKRPRSTLVGLGTGISSGGS
jgi:hypothetical protein